jgi:hypothetical protein
MDCDILQAFNREMDSFSYGYIYLTWAEINRGLVDPMGVIEERAKNLKPGEEIFIYKSEIKEPLIGWNKAIITIPHEGSRASYRKGRLHMHDMGDYYALHVDRIDPKEDPVGHLKDDAPETLAMGVVGSVTAYPLLLYSTKKKEKAQKKESAKRKSDQ